MNNINNRKKRKEFQVDDEVLKMIDELSKYHGKNFNDLANFIVKAAHKQMQKNTSVANIEEVSIVLDSFQERLELSQERIEMRIDEIKEMKDLLYESIKNNDKQSDEILKINQKYSKMVDVVKELQNKVASQEKTIAELSNRKMLGFIKG